MRTQNVECQGLHTNKHTTLLLLIPRPRPEVRQTRSVRYLLALGFLLLLQLLLRVRLPRKQGTDWNQGFAKRTLEVQDMITSEPGRTWDCGGSCRGWRLLQRKHLA